MKIKVCGMRDAQNIKHLASLQPDYMGFIFYPGSKRYVEDIDKEMLINLPECITKTGVFVDAAYADIKEKITRYGLGAVQLHGNEPAEFCTALKQHGVEVIKAFGIHQDFDFIQLDQYLGAVDFFLFDTKTAEHGGSGERFNWDILKNYTYNIPYFLSGGIGPEHIPEISLIADSRLYAVDLNSRFEIKPAIKDIEKLKIAFKQLKNAAAASRRLEEI